MPPSRTLSAFGLWILSSDGEGQPWLSLRPAERGATAMSLQRMTFGGLGCATHRILGEFENREWTPMNETVQATASRLSEAGWHHPDVDQNLEIFAFISVHSRLKCLPPERSAPLDYGFCHPTAKANRMRVQFNTGMKIDLGAELEAKEPQILAGRFWLACQESNVTSG